MIAIILITIYGWIVAKFFQLIRISNKEFVNKFVFPTNIRVQIRCAMDGKHKPTSSTKSLSTFEELKNIKNVLAIMFENLQVSIKVVEGGLDFFRQSASFIFMDILALKLGTTSQICSTNLLMVFFVHHEFVSEGITVLRGYNWAVPKHLL